MDPQVPPSTMPANFGVPENTPPAPPPPANLPSMENKKLKTYLVMLGVVLLLVAVILGSYFLFLRKKTGNPPPKNTSNVINLPKYFINCDDVRHVHEEENLIYVACLGGVLVVDKGSGEVRDQIGLPDGLSNSTVTSLIKKGDQLFLGTQDGVTVFNLKTREAKKISVEEGLVNGANVELFEDGDNIWVATFDGVSLLDTKTLGLTNYTSELDHQAEKRNIVNMLVTEKYVYFLEVASVHSRGAVIMFNKETSEFKVFGPDAFGVTGQYARIDFNTLGQFKDKVFVAEGNKLFTANMGEENWQKIESANAFISSDMKTEFAALNILPNTDTRGILLSSGNKIYRYIPESDATEVVYDFEGYAGILFRNSGDSVWFRNSGDGSWISKLFLTSLKVTQIYLKDRPVSVSRLLAAIDNKPVILSLDGVYEYNLETDKFKKWDGFGASNVGYGYSETGLLPIPDTDEVFSVWQSCGQGCEKPLAQIYNYTTGQVEDLEIPDEVLSAIAFEVMGGITYDSINLAWYDFGNSEIGFYNSYGADNPPESLVYNYSTKTWRVLESAPEGVTMLKNENGVFCNKVYVFSSNSNKFSKDDCTGVAENEQYVWVVEEGRIKQTTKSNGEVKTLNVPSLPPKYTPFETVPNSSFGPIAFADHMLWIVSSRGGVVSYNPADSSFKLYGPLEGVLSHEGANVLISENIWLLAGWGGLSGIEK